MKLKTIDKISDYIASRDVQELIAQKICVPQVDREDFYDSLSIFSCLIKGAIKGHRNIAVCYEPDCNHFSVSDGSAEPVNSIPVGCYEDESDALLGIIDYEQKNGIQGYSIYMHQQPDIVLPAYNLTRDTAIESNGYVYKNEVDKAVRVSHGVGRIKIDDADSGIKNIHESTVSSEKMQEINQAIPNNGRGSIFVGIEPIGGINKKTHKVVVIVDGYDRAESIRDAVQDLLINDSRF